MTEAKRAPTPVIRLARWWWLLVSAIWIAGFAMLLDWSPVDEVVYRRPIVQAPSSESPAAGAQDMGPQMPFLTNDTGDAPSDARRAEVRAQMQGEAWLGTHPPNCWGDLYSAPDATGSEMQWRCETRSSWARMIITNLLVLASFPVLLPLAITGVLRLGRRMTRNGGAR